MKNSGLFFFLAVLSALILVFACSKKNNPAGPGQNTPTVTMTSCVGCTATITPTITQTSVQSHYTFEGPGLDGWAIGGWGGSSDCAATAASITNTPVFSGTGALKLDYSLTSSCDQAVFTLTFSQPIDLYGKAIVVHVLSPVDETNYGVKIGISGSMGDISGNPLTFTANTWTIVSWSPSLNGEEATTKITIITGKKTPASPDLSDSMYIDEVVWF